MKTSEIREMSNADLQDKIKEEKELLSKMKINHAISDIENPLKIKFIRRNVARLNTELQRRKLAEKHNN